MSKPLVMTGWDISVLRESHRAIRAGMPRARERAARIMACMILRRVVREGRTRAKDTNRYIAAYARAHNDIAEPPMAQMMVPAITESRMVPLARHQLIRRIAYLDEVRGSLSKWIVAQEQRPGGAQWPSVVRARKKLRGVEANITRAKAQLEIADTPDGAFAAVIFGAGLTRANLHTSRTIARFMTRIYGGTATVLRSGGDQGTALVKMVNHEPHALLVEKRVGLMRESIGMARRMGVRTVGRAQLEGIEKVLLERSLAGATRVQLPPADGGMGGGL